MIEKISFVLGMILLAIFVLVLASFGWVNGYPWWRRKEFQKI
jgi:hypothetical protein